jgi:putative transposase
VHNYQTLIQEALEAQFTRFLGAAPYERTGERLGVRNGSRKHTLLKRVGRLYLRVPRDWAGAFTPTAFVRFQRAERALLSTLNECFLQSISTRKVRQIV